MPSVGHAPTLMSNQIIANGYMWIHVGKLSEIDCDFSLYNKNIGVYKAILNGDIVYVGKATEINNGGFRKRLRDYTRTSDSARNFPAGIKMNLNKNKIEIYIYITATAKEAEDTEAEFIKRYNPIWNLITL